MSSAWRRPRSTALPSIPLGRMGAWACRSPSQPRRVPVDAALLHAPRDVSFTSCVLRTGGATLFLDGDGRIVLGEPVRLHPPPIIRKAAVDRRLYYFPL